ncbi:MAG TPA: response regulator [Nitrososphaeraceae archaeon]|nr:response regulator [Nitrososphaeraceae archaeon]
MSQLQQEQDLTVLEPSISSQKKRILVVDDEVDITTIFKLALERVDFQVDVYNDPLLALSDYKAGMYDLLLFDIRMPGMNGFELYRKIKDIEEEEKKVKNGKPRVCFITAFEEFRSEFKETFPTVEEVDCFLKKPIPMPDLVMKVKSQLGLL